MLTIDKPQTAKTVTIPVVIAIVALVYHLYCEAVATRQREDALVEYIKASTEILKADTAKDITIDNSSFGAAMFVENKEDERTQ